MSTREALTETRPHFGATYRVGDTINVITMYAGGEREVFTIESIVGPDTARLVGRRTSRDTRELAHAAKPTAPLPFSVALGSLDAAEQATTAAHAEFGSGSLGLANGWSTDRIEALR